MPSWVARKRVEEISRALEEGASTQEISQEQATRGLGPALLYGGGAGTTAGILGARLHGGEAAIAPFKKVLKEGINAKSLGSLKKMPMAMKASPLAGLGLGAAAGMGMWSQGVPRRRREAREVVRGLLAERILQRNALRSALQSNRPYTGSILSGVPITSASASPPHVVIPGNVGV